MASNVSLVESESCALPIPLVGMCVCVYTWQNKHKYIPKPYILHITSPLALSAAV